MLKQQHDTHVFEKPNTLNKNEAEKLAKIFVKKLVNQVDMKSIQWNLELKGFLVRILLEIY